MKISDSWSMTFGDQDVDLGLVLPDSHILVARVHGEPDPSLSAFPRTSYLCAASEEDVVVRADDGRFVWHDRPSSSAPREAESDEGLLPPDWGGETLAMVSGFHLIEWLAADTYEIDGGGRLKGQSTNHGLFVADLHPDYGFVTAVSVGDPGSRRPLIEIHAYWLVPFESTLMSGHGLDPAVFLDLLS